MIGYRKMKASSNWKLERKGPDVVLTRKAYDKETGESHDDKVRTITSAELARVGDGIEMQIKKLEKDLADVQEAIQDIKKLESIIDPDAQ